MTQHVDLSSLPGRPSWDIVTSYVEKRLNISDNDAAIIGLVLIDMRERDAFGRQRYQVPLTSGNGRNHLVEAYEEVLDASVYLATELDEFNVGPLTPLSSNLDRDRLWYLRDVQQIFARQISTLIELRKLIEEKKKLS